MKKKLLLLLFTIIVISTASAQDSLYYSIYWKPTFNYQKARVKHEGIFHYRYNNGVILDSFLLNANLYDSLGRLTRMDVYYASKWRTRYDHFYTGNRLDSTVQDDRWLNVKTTHHYHYDANGNLVLTEIFNNGQKTVQERYTYNENNQPLQTFRKVGQLPEVLTIVITYRADRLVQQIDYLFEGAEAKDNFSYLYTYANGTKTTTRFFQRQGKEKRLIDCIRTYNDKNQLIEKINPPLPFNNWLPPGIHPRKDEMIETYRYHENGMLAEVKATTNNRIEYTRKYVYFYWNKAVE